MSSFDEQHGELQKLWGENTTKAPATVSIVHIKRDAAKFRRTLWFRDAREYFAAVVVIGIFAIKAAHPANTVELVGDVLCALSGIWVIAVLWRNRPGRPPRPEELVDVHLAWLQRLLQTQGHLLSKAWGWYVSPIVVSVLVSFAGQVMARGHWVYKDTIYTICVFSSALVISWLNRRAGEQLLERAKALT